MKSYGLSQTKEPQSKVEMHIEEIQIQGFSVMPGVLSPHETQLFREKLEHVYCVQESEVGRSNLQKIQELNVARALLTYDSDFSELLLKPPIRSLMNAFFGENYILALQNGVINRPEQEHRQSAWHRDLPYQDYTTSKPLGINAYFCLDDYSTENGSTVFLPYSHKLDRLPSSSYLEKHSVSAQATAGSVIFFDSFIFHKAGINTTNNSRSGINHLYARPFIQQQINLPCALQDNFSDDPYLNSILGYRWRSPDNVKDFRLSRLKRSDT